VLAIAAGVYYFTWTNDKIVPAFDVNKLNLVIGGNVIDAENKAKYVNNEVLLSFDLVKEYFDPYIWWDENLGKVTVTTKDRVIRMQTDNLNALVNNEPIELNIPVTVENNIVYVPIDFLSEFYNIEINYIEKNNVIVIDYINSVIQTAEVIEDGAAIRTGRSVRYPMIRRISLEEAQNEENKLRIFEEYDKWYKVRTSDGAVGYIQKKHVVANNPVIAKLPEPEKKDSTWKPQNGKISLVWEMIWSKPDISKLEVKKGVDVLSPTWFDIANEEGDLTNRSDAKYVEWAHNNGFQVWALLKNDYLKQEQTHSFLMNTDARDKVIKSLLAYVALYDIDGINIDLENINKQYKDALTQFVRELTPFLKEQGLVVSIAVTIPDGSDNWSLCYDRKALAEVVDYVMLMAYDQHWATSPVAGSVAQITWVEKNIEKTLKEVPKEKLLLGVPTYTRVWKEEKDENGQIKVTSPTPLSMRQAKNKVKENNAAVEWDEESGQFYAEYSDGEATYKIWLEDENSINLRTSLVHKYDLAGAAVWSGNDAASYVWDIFETNLKTISSYNEWLKENEAWEASFVFN